MASTSRLSELVWSSLERNQLTGSAEHVDRAELELSAIDGTQTAELFLLLRDGVREVGCPRGLTLAGTSAASLIGHLLELSYADPVRAQLPFWQWHNVPPNPPSITTCSNSRPWAALTRYLSAVLRREDKRAGPIFSFAGERAGPAIWLIEQRPGQHEFWAAPEALERPVPSPLVRIAAADMLVRPAEPYYFNEQTVEVLRSLGFSPFEANTLRRHLASGRGGALERLATAMQENGLDAATALDNARWLQTADRSCEWKSHALAMHAWRAV